MRNHAGHKAHQMPESIIFLKTVKVVSSVALTKTKWQIYLGRVQDATVRRTGPQRSSVQLVLWFCVSNCGIIYQIREMWRSEAIEQVVLFLFDIVDHYHDLGILMPIVLCFDDACHLLGRLLWGLFGRRHCWCAWSSPSMTFTWSTTRTTFALVH